MKLVPNVEAIMEITTLIVKWIMIRLVIEEKDIEDWAGKITIKTKRPAQMRKQILDDYNRINTLNAEDEDR